MKIFYKLMTIGLVLGAVILALNLSAHAEGKATRDKGGVCQKGGPAEGEQARGKGPWDGAARMEKMKEELGLSAAQVKSLEEVHQKGRERSEALREKMKKDMGDLAEKTKAGADAGILKPLLEKVYADQKNLFVTREKQMEETRNILTVTQQAKWLLGREKGTQEDPGGFKKHRPGKKTPEGKPGNSQETAPPPAE